MKRRQFLKMISGGVLLTGLGSYIWAAPTAKSARVPWHEAGNYADPMLFALSHAILAPNPHNRQPWLVEIKNNNEAVLFCDQERHLPMTDPFDRQITIGLGCFLEIFTLAAQHKNKSVNIHLFPQGAHDIRLDRRPVAHIALTTGSVKTADLFAQITNRYTDRSPFAGRVPSQDDMEAITAVAGMTAKYTANPKRVDAIRAICRAAAIAEFMTPRTHGESVELMRVGRKAVTQNPDGISIEGPMIELLNLSGALSPQAMRDHNSSGFKQGLNMYLKAVDTAHSFLWISLPDNSRVSQIMAGRAYVKANLMATKLGLSMHPLSQALQEYPEVSTQLNKIHELLDTPTPNRIQMLARVGYGKASKRSPRWPLQARTL